MRARRLTSLLLSAEIALRSGRRRTSIGLQNGGVSHETRQNNSRRRDGAFWRDARFARCICHAGERFESRGERTLCRHTGRTLVAASLLGAALGMEAPLGVA